MMTIGLAMAACLGWGIADFIGGLKSRDIPTLTVLLVSNAVGACLLGLMLAGSGRSIAGGLKPGLGRACGAHGFCGHVSALPRPGHRHHGDPGSGQRHRGYSACDLGIDRRG